MYVEVAVNLPPVRGTFHYHVPPELQGVIKAGHLITASFGNRKVQGVVLSLCETAPVADTRPVEMLVDSDPVLTSTQLELAAWLQQETKTPLMECITLMLPPGLSQRADSVYTLQEKGLSGYSSTEKRLIALLEKRGQLRGRQIQRALSRMNWRPVAEKLIRKGIISRTSVLDPPQVNPRHVRIAQLAKPPADAREKVKSIGRSGSSADVRRRAIIDTMIAEGEPIEVTWIYAETGANLSDLRQLESEGLIALSQAEIWRDPLSHFDFVPTKAPLLTSDQRQVWDVLKGHMDHGGKGDPHTFLLHGVTGSGKTEIYLRAVDEITSQGRGAIILVPEIALTPQTVRRFVARFPGQVGLIHSRLSRGERYDTWRRCRAGELRIVVGPRSALFTPIPDIGLIVLDESHDESYKEDLQAPRYHCRETAIQYARLLHATCILGSATPDLTTMYRAKAGALQYLSLPQRILGHQERITQQVKRLGTITIYQHQEAEASSIDLPPVRVIDMRQELKAGNRTIMSRALRSGLEETLQAGQQAMLFLNRRGSATFVFCRDCGEVFRCPRCDTSMTYHEDQTLLLCHHCGYRRSSPRNCPRCKSTRIKFFGAGTQTIEQTVQDEFPQARTIRWDWDTTRSKDSHDLILSHFANHRADVLIGTQMIAKGLDLPMVTLVGVISADTGLNLPDFRACERTFQVLTQVAGRAGRGLFGGRVILQSYQPDHYVIRAASQHNYHAFYLKELAYRQVLSYPPFARLTRLLYKHHSNDRAEEEATRLAGKIQSTAAFKDKAVDMIGPAPCFFMRVRSQYRWQIILRSPDPTPLIPAELPEGWIIDVDPVSLL